jgi:hypothetical protein
MVSIAHQRMLARAAGVTALVLAGLFAFSVAFGPGNLLHGDPSTSTALSFSSSHAGWIRVLGLLDGMINTLFGILIVLLVAVAGIDGVLARVAYVTAGAAAAIQWAHAGMLLALADLAQRGGADAGVLALFTLGKTMDEADGILIGVAMACAGWLLLRSGRAPSAVAWLTIAVAAISVAVTVVTDVGGPDLGPASVVAAWVWLLGIGILLVVKPTSRRSPARTASAPL